MPVRIHSCIDKPAVSCSFVLHNNLPGGLSVQLPPDSVDIEILHDATRREARGG